MPSRRRCQWYRYSWKLAGWWGPGGHPRFNQRCRLLVVGRRMGTVLVQFEDGELMVTLRYSLRRVTEEAHVRGPSRKNQRHQLPCGRWVIARELGDGRFECSDTHDGEPVVGTLAEIEQMPDPHSYASYNGANRAVLRLERIAGVEERA